MTLDTRRKADIMPKTKVGFYADENDVRRARGAFLATMSMPGQPRTLSDFIARAVKTEVERLEVAHNNGEPFPDADAGDAPRGRPLVS